VKDWLVNQAIMTSPPEPPISRLHAVRTGTRQIATYY
jgi:hypothetical protein